MADALHIDGGGSLAVATDELFDHAGVHARLGEVAGQLHGALNQVARIAEDDPFGRGHMTDGMRHLAEVQELAEHLQRVLHAAAVGYGMTERLSEHVRDSIAAVGWHIGGQVFALAWPLVLLAAAGHAGTAALAIWLATGLSPAQWLMRHPELYTNPAVTGLVGDFAEHADEALVGALGLSPAVAAMLGGTPGMARMLIGAHPYGTLRETPVRIERAVPMPSPSPPKGLLEAATRIKAMESAGAQVVVEQYELTDGTGVANVYIDGTADWSVTPDGEPWDMTSNLGAVAQNHDVGAAEAVKLAMRDAGIESSTPVQLFGYSQGGLQAALVAQQGEFNVVSLVTIGAPVGDMQIDASIDAIAIGHLDDLVFALSDDTMDPDVLRVTTTRFGLGAVYPTDQVAPGHQFSGYVQTLDRVDHARAPELTARLDRILARPEGATASSSVAYKLERYDPQECG